MNLSETFIRRPVATTLIQIAILKDKYAVYETSAPH